MSVKSEVGLQHKYQPKRYGWVLIGDKERWQLVKISNMFCAKTQNTDKGKEQATEIKRIAKNKDKWTEKDRYC